MKNALIILADGFEELEAITIIDVIRRSGIQITVCGLKNMIIKSTHDVIITADTVLDKVLNENFDLIILPGGQPGTNNLADDLSLIELIKKQDKEKKYTAAICAAPVVLAKAGILNRRKATCYPSLLSSLNAMEVIHNEKVVVDNHIITSQGPGTALAFSYKLVELLLGNKISDKLKKEMIYN